MPHKKRNIPNKIKEPLINSIRRVMARRKDAKKRTTTWQGLFLQSYCISSIPGGQMQELEQRTTARTQEVEQRMEQLPRKPKPSLHVVNEHFELLCNDASTVSAD